MKTFNTLKEMMESEDFKQILYEEWADIKNKRNDAKTKAAMNKMQLRAHPIETFMEFTTEQFVEEFKKLEDKVCKYSSNERHFLTELMHVCIFKTMSKISQENKAEKEALEAEQHKEQTTEEFQEAEVVE